MNDLISRQVAIDAFGLSEKTRKYGGDHSGYDTRMLYEIQDILESLPSAQPERQKGEWIEISSISHTYKCSVCGRLLVNITDGKNNVAKNYPYCHCGADMRGEQE